MTPSERGSGAKAYPVPDRSDYTPSFEKRPENDFSLDIGWAEGTMSDGRPYRVECWAQGQTTFLTFFFSVVGLERSDESAIAGQLAREGLLVFAAGKSPMALRRHTDPAGHDLWSATFTVGTEDELFVSASVPLRSYGGR